MNSDKIKTENSTANKAQVPDQDQADEAPREHNGPKGPEPTRYGDWEQKGRCSDF